MHFDYDSSVVKGSEKANLEAVASFMKTADASVGLLVEGHCDERGTEDYNNALGERRATALREALINAGLIPNTLSPAAMAKYKPVAHGQDESAYRQNRRVSSWSCVRRNNPEPIRPIWPGSFGALPAALPGLTCLR